MILALLVSAWALKVKAEMREWENTMGLERHPVVIEPLKGLCAQHRFRPVLTKVGMGLEPYFVVNPSQICQDLWTPRELALHEACHARMQHGYVNLSRREMEKEANRCANWYREKRPKEASK